MYTSVGTATPVRKNQAQVLTAGFRKLLSEGWYLRPPSWFARELNITTSHLNDSVKQITGYSCTYWLQDAMITEARRLLYYTNNDVKEIAFTLGFEDPAYFSRLFKKMTGETALAFRNKFRE
ncbi:AraC family transcriptional regulator [Ferruginibacter sp. HRS2-29]|uniref:helix-turn-helix domain-containing protein n=1 Tax=Ferruginibacter sp. HRS2-29 TaxID=2487334 RepID=UPI0020CC2964|nr:helix-turn-helix domain-containing protein [Ferruginibacter sp. HRS2-29]